MIVYLVILVCGRSVVVFCLLIVLLVVDGVVDVDLGGF